MPRRASSPMPGPPAFHEHLPNSEPISLGVLTTLGNQVLPIAAETLFVAPIPALVPAAKILDDI
jgi:hypothetical protein